MNEVKIIYSNRISLVKTSVEDWIKSNENNVNVLAISGMTNNYGSVTYILYEKREGNLLSL